MKSAGLAPYLPLQREFWSEEFLTRLQAHERSWRDEAYPDYGGGILDRPTLDEIFSARVVAFWLPHLGKGKYAKRWVITLHDNTLAVKIYFRHLLNRATLRWMPSILIAAYAGKKKLELKNISVDFEETILSRPFNNTGEPASPNIRQQLEAYQNLWSAEFLADVEKHELSWGKKQYIGRPSLDALLESQIVIFWSHIVRRSVINDRLIVTVGVAPIK